MQSYLLVALESEEDKRIIWIDTQSNIIQFII